jgi:para-aminobenzoate synthetase component 1
VVTTFEGEFRGYRFADISGVPPLPAKHQPIPRAAWVSSMQRDEYLDAVSAVRADIARGWVYQVNLCRVLSQRLSKPIDPVAAWQVLRSGNPSPFGGLLSIAGELDVISASPELFLRRDGTRVTSSPIKGTAATANGMLPKDTAENIMIVDLIRNDLARVARPGSVEVPELMRVEQHPGLVHLVSDVVAEVDPDLTLRQLLSAMLPPGSVSGAPKSSALDVITRLEPVPRDVYCGAFGWIDADARQAELAVAIRTFWQRPDGDGAVLQFGTGAGITWGSDPVREWEETELKANRLIGVLAGEVAGL